jgi:predicted  nucleic acid-binding Zn-ribbon protein
MTIKSYKDLCNEIEIWKERLKTYKTQIEAIRKLARLDGPQDIRAIDYTKPIGGTSVSQIGFEEALEMLAKIQGHIFLHQRTIKEMEKSKKKIEDSIEKLEGLDKRVAYLRDIEGLALVEISNKLGYSYQYIKEISAKNKITYQ